MKKIIIPEEKLNELAQEVSSRLHARHFFDQGKIDGDGLRKFVEHQQVNKFLIFQIFQVWEMQINKLYHPYFDLDHPDIQQTVKLLKNQISQHISISEDEFQPLLKRSVYNNLKLLLDPEETFGRFFFAQADKISIDVYARYAQFFSDLDFVVNSILRYFQKNKLATVEKDVFFLKMKKAVDVYNKKSGQSFDQYRDGLFKELTGKGIFELEEEVRKAKEEEERRLRQREEEKRRMEEAERRRQEEEQRQKEEEEQRRLEAERIRQEEERRRKEEEERRKREEEERKRAEEQQRQSSFFDSLGSVDNFFDLDEEEEEEEQLPDSGPTDEGPIEEKTEEVEEKPQDPSTNRPEPISNGHSPYVWTPAEEKESSKAPQEEKQEEPQTKEEPKREEPRREEEDQREKSSTLLDHLKKKDSDTPKESKASVLDMVNQRSKTVADRIVGKKNEGESQEGGGKIKLDEIPIHKQYQYVQKVFEGNNVRFRIIVDKVNNASNHNEIDDILQKFVLNNDKLNREDPVVKEFIGMLQKRF